MYGTQTVQVVREVSRRFENDVKMYGTQTDIKAKKKGELFENDVKMYGTQTFPVSRVQKVSLRMM